MPGTTKNTRMREVVENAMRGEWHRALAATNGDVVLAGKNLGYTRAASYAALKRLGITLERVTTTRIKT